MLNIGEISKIANAIRRAVAKVHGVNAGNVNYKMCFAVARKGGNAITVLNAINANNEFLGKLVKIKRKISGFFRCFVDGKFHNIILGHSSTDVAKAVARSIGAVGTGFSCVRDATHWMPIPERPV